METKAFFIRLASIVGGFSSPSKMPCHSFSIPAVLCKVGGQLRKIAGSVCSKCYARKGRYVFPNVRAAMERRFAALDHPEWVPIMARAINGLETGPKGSGFFRWHDSGDLQDLQHLERIADVCRKTPDVRHWLPTKEYGLIRGALRNGFQVPPNLVIRVSAPMVDSAPPVLAGLPTSTVSTDKAAATCLAYTRKGVCGPCRACWSPVVENVIYPAH